MKHPLLITNWKMQLSYNDALQLAAAYKNELSSTNCTLVCCPSYTALSSVAQIFKEKSIALGAQDCSAFASGPYTGQESAVSLAQVGCSYCIIGHSERRSHNKEGNEDIANKMIQLLDYQITPIVCIGETQQEYDHNQTIDALTRQLAPIFNASHASKNQPAHIIIAYEPVWSIGSGIVPSHGYLSTIFDWLHTECSMHLNTTDLSLIYGGSVSPDTLEELITIPHINGFLIGGASLNIQKLQRIVSSL